MNLLQLTTAGLDCMTHLLLTLPLWHITLKPNDGNFAMDSSRRLVPIQPYFLYWAQLMEGVDVAHLPCQICKVRLPCSLLSYSLAQSSGAKETALMVQQIPMQVHTFAVSSLGTITTMLNVVA